MDSLTQIALGSAVAVGVMGRHTAARKAAAWGAVAGTLPDLDALLDHGDALLNMVLHRAESHALLYLTLLAPLLAWAVSRLHGEAALFRRWWLALWLVLITHPLLDTMTVYGTQLLLPFTRHPFGVGSVFIIDPAYTLPLIAGVVAALRMRDGARGLRWNTAGLVLSTAYLGWSVFAQAQVMQVARASLQAQGVAAQRLLVTPLPLQTLLWRVVALPDDPADPQFREAVVSVFDGPRPVDWAQHDRGAGLMAQHGQAAPVAQLTRFAHGFVKLAATPDGQLRITDLRMGQEPVYVFNFDLGPLDAVGSVPATQVSARPAIGPTLRWMWQRLPSP
ncbi:metal-dependent hydrolase [Sphaerotilus sp.]|uniref:metal-dependent hydrolase n=1 Tax=Sphaerotilus sp. TaxID=2093942 RepID=UPI002ACE331E|nr:metal-dependent hydrolase [Sphaerotilus sp.]MDZ7857372.1 metal-dependent hydrolase [Sphaerotilus sp.]